METKILKEEIRKEYLRHPFVLEYSMILQDFLYPLKLQEYLSETLKFIYILISSEFENYILGKEIEEKGDKKYSKPNFGRVYRLDILSELIDVKKVLVFRITSPRDKNSTNPEDWWSSELKWVRTQMLSKERSNNENVMIISTLAKIIENSPMGLSTIHDDSTIHGIKRIGNFKFKQSAIIKEVNIDILNRLLK